MKGRHNILCLPFMMIQREIQDKNGTTWQCVQAFAGVETKTTHKAVEHSENKDGTVTVICTPSGGAQTVRLQLPANWNDQMENEELAEAISHNR
jgi:hypothetical protein